MRTEAKLHILLIAYLGDILVLLDFFFEFHMMIEYHFIQNFKRVT